MSELFTFPRDQEFDALLRFSEIARKLTQICVDKSQSSIDRSELAVVKTRERSIISREILRRTKTDR
jgi:hypothetical protein